jgi:hypothetical protein
MMKQAPTTEQTEEKRSAISTAWPSLGDNVMLTNRGQDARWPWTFAIEWVKDLEEDGAQGLATFLMKAFPAV